METQYFKFYSPALNRDMECKVYGHAGRPVLFIPCQDGRFFDFENFHMTDTWSPTGASAAMSSGSATSPARWSPSSGTW